MTTTTHDTPALALADFPLRERKRARLKIGLWTALRERIEATPFAEISVRELAAAVEVSEPTFFAHFSSKAELLAYHICLWRIGAVLAAPRGVDGVEFLQRFFDHTAQAILDGPQLWFEITAEVARGGGLCAVLDVRPAERLLAFDDPAALDVEITPQADLFAKHLAIARNQGRFAGAVDVATTGLVTAFYGLPLAVGRDGLGVLAATYRAQLDRVLTAPST